MSDCTIGEEQGDWNEEVRAADEHLVPVSGSSVGDSGEGSDRSPGRDPDEHAVVAFGFAKEYEGSEQDVDGSDYQ